ncbi:MAG: Rieske 2Fe-2S domain-containing protein [Candidatus Riflebacteria bacterium]|nr:Rieske 2Fe-2S domain-containing protein [Candidatus Riflebacteria bacterium]
MDSVTPDREVRAATRRDFLDLAVMATAILTAAGLGVPTLMFIWPPEEVTRRAGHRVRVAGPDEVPPGKAKTVLLNGKPVLVLNTGDTMLALTATCPHLGCVVRWNEQMGKFICPCHGASFDVRGNVLSGPAPAPLGAVPITLAKDGIYLG